MELLEVEGFMIATDVKMGRNVVIYHPHLVNLYGCEIGDGCKIGAFVEIRRQVKIGRHVKIQAFAFIPDGSTMRPDDWEIIPTLVKRGASIGANATILCGLTIGEHAMVAAGAVVTR